MDRNTQRRDFKCLGLVALRKESVDRNNDTPSKKKINPTVALRKESVDRNKIGIAPIDGIIESLSVRRAWIEILAGGNETLS